MLCIQNTSNIYRKNAWFKLRDRDDAAQEIRDLDFKDALKLFSEPINFSLEAAVPDPTPFEDRLRGMLEENAGFILTKEQHETGQRVLEEVGQFSLSDGGEQTSARFHVTFHDIVATLCRQANGYTAGERAGTRAREGPSLHLSIAMLLTTSSLAGGESSSRPASGSGEVRGPRVQSPGGDSTAMATADAGCQHGVMQGRGASILRPLRLPPQTSGANDLPAKHSAQSQLLQSKLDRPQTSQEHRDGNASESSVPEH